MKVNDYVKTKDGLIHKITDIFNTTKQVATDKGKYVYEYNEVVKSSPNIIDLIEIGDLVKIEYYVPKYHTRLTRLFEVEYKENDWIRFCNSHCDLSIFNHKWGDKGMKPVIKSIVSKEQLERCEYKI